MHGQQHIKKTVICAISFKSGYRDLVN